MHPKRGTKENNMDKRPPSEAEIRASLERQKLTDVAPGDELGRTECGLRLNGIFKQSLPHAPLVTVITVVFNREKTIERCILSVLNQTYVNLEYIIIDGASFDETTRIIERYADSIDYYLSEPDDGIYNAINKGIRLASGDFLLLLHSDDWFREDAVEKLVEAAVKSSADVVHADAIIVDGSNKNLGTLKGCLDDGLYTKGNPIRHETMLVKKAVHDRHGYYDESYRIIADYEFVIRLHEAGCTFEHVSACLLYFSNTGISFVDQEVKLTERARVFHELFPFLDDVDLAAMKKGGLGIRERLELIDKHKTKSELFVRSMAYNMAKSAQNEETAQAQVLLKYLRRPMIWRLMLPFRWWFRRLRKKQEDKS